MFWKRFESNFKFVIKDKNLFGILLDFVEILKHGNFFVLEKYDYLYLVED